MISISVISVKGFSFKYTDGVNTNIIFNFERDQSCLLKICLFYYIINSQFVVATYSMQCGFLFTVDIFDPMEEFLRLICTIRILFEKDCRVNNIWTGNLLCILRNIEYSQFLIFLECIPLNFFAFLWNKDTGELTIFKRSPANEF